MPLHRQPRNSFLPDGTIISQTDARYGGAHEVSQLQFRRRLTFLPNRLMSPTSNRLLFQAGQQTKRFCTLMRRKDLFPYGDKEAVAFLLFSELMRQLFFTEPARCGTVRSRRFRTGKRRRDRERGEHRTGGSDGISQRKPRRPDRAADGKGCGRRGRGMHEGCVLVNRREHICLIAF